MIAVKQFFNTSEIRLHFSDLFELFFILPKQPIKLCLEEKLFQISTQKAGRM